MRRFLVAAILLALAAPGPAPAAERPKFVTLVRGTTYEFRDAAAKAVVSIPISLSAGARMKRIQATVVSVSLGQREDLALVDAFTARPARAANGRGPRLNMTIDTDPGLEPGTYNLIVDVRRTGKLKRGQRRHQRFKLALVHVAATLRAPQAIVVDHTGGFLFVDGKTVARPLRLQENSRKTQLSGITVTQIDGPTGSKVASGELTFKEIAPIPPGGHAAAKPTLAGDFPLGSSAGTLQVDAPQLAGSVTVAFEVRRSLHWLWLLLGIVVGVLAGVLVRQVLAGVIALNQARQPGYALIDAIGVEYERRRDEGFRATITGIRAELENTLQTEHEPAKIDTATAATRTKLQSAVTDLDTQRDDAETAVTSLVATIRTRWTAPKEITDGLGRSAGTLDEAGRMLDAYDVGGASAVVRDCRAAIDTLLKEQVPPWAAAVRNFLATLEAARLPSPVMGEVKIARSEIEGALTSTGVEQPTIDPDTVMRGVHAAETRLRRLLAEGLARITLAADAVVDALAGVAGRAVIDAVTAAEQGLVEALRQGAASGADLTTIGQRATDLAEALRAAIKDPVPDSEQATLTRISATLDAGRYVEAARLAVQAAPKPTKDRVLGPGHAGAAHAAAVDMEPPELAFAAGAAAAAMPAVVVHAAGALRDSAFDLTQARAASRAALDDATALRAFIVGIGVVLVGCGLFLPSFTGTFEQFLAAFLWGFAADVTSEGLYQLAKSSGSPASSVPAGTTKAA